MDRANIKKIVSYEKYCKDCIHSKELDESGSTCDECLAEFVRDYSHKPLNFEEKRRKV